jgi:tetratricopeptide (TPR) repeat protein
LLLAILAKPEEGPITRANAEGYLGHFASDPAVLAALQNHLHDKDPLVRAFAALRMNAGAADRQSAIASLIPMLSDPIATVRVGATISLVAMGVKQLPGEDGERLKLAEQVYEARAEHHSDDAGQQIAAGRFYLLIGDIAKAVDALELSLKLEPAAPAQYLLAYGYAQQGHVPQARELLKSISPSDSQYPSAQRLLQVLASQ